MKFISKFWAGTLSISLAASALFSLAPLAAEAHSESDFTPTIMHVDSIREIQTSDTSLNETSLILLSDIAEKDVSSKAIATLNEVLDNGTDLFVEGELASSVTELLGYELPASEEDAVMIGVYLTTQGGDYSAIPVTASLIQDDQEIGKPADVKAALEKLRKASASHLINANDLLTDMQQDTSETEFLRQLDDAKIASLQTSTVIGNSFKDGAVFRYFYKEGSVNGTGTTYQYSDSENINGWVKLGSIRINGYVVNIKTVGTKTYDDVYSVVTASGLNDKYVKEYKYNMELTTTGSNYSILDETWLYGNIKSTTTTSIATGFSSDGKNTITTTISYSYNPNGQNITNTFGLQYARTWTAKPASNVDNGSWKIQPSITILNNTGTTTNTSVKLYVNYFQLSGGLRTYTSSASVPITLTFKNHA